MKNIRTAEFNLKGLTPLLMHADDVEASDLLKDWRKSPGNKNQSVAGDDRSPAWTWQTYWYLDENLTERAAQTLAISRRAMKEEQRHLAQSVRETSTLLKPTQRLF